MDVSNLWEMKSFKAVDDLAPILAGQVHKMFNMIDEPFGLLFYCSQLFEYEDTIITEID